jgi:hypothetical protein
VRVIGAYFPNGQAPDSDKFAYKMRWLTALHAWLLTSCKQSQQLVLMGDFNIAPEDRDVYDPVAWAGQIHCTPEERSHFQQLVALGLRRRLPTLSISPSRAGAGGTTATWPFARTRACASTTSWSAKPIRLQVDGLRDRQGCPARTSGPATTRRFGLNWTTLPDRTAP